MRVSHETIYQSLFVQGRGELRRELARCLGAPWQRPGRAGRPALLGGSCVKDMVMIADRPAEAEDRAVPGTWRRPHRRKERRWHTCRTHQSACALVASEGREDSGQCRGGHAERDQILAPRADEVDHVGPRKRDGRRTRTSLLQPVYPSTSAIHTPRGNADPTRTPTDFYANTCRRAPIFPSCRQRT